MLTMLYELIPLHYPSAIFPLRRLDVRAGYARYLHQLQRAAYLMAILEATKQDAVERLRTSPECISVTPLAVDDRRCYPRTPEEIGNVLARHGLRWPYVLHVGSSVYHKNTAAVVRAFRLFCQETRAWPERRQEPSVACIALAPTPSDAHVRLPSPWTCVEPTGRRGTCQRHSC
jgi:hypothetical protein